MRYLNGDLSGAASGCEKDMRYGKNKKDSRGKEIYGEKYPDWMLCGGNAIGAGKGYGSHDCHTRYIGSWFGLDTLSGCGHYTDEGWSFTFGHACGSGTIDGHARLGGGRADGKLGHIFYNDDYKHDLINGKYLNEWCENLNMAIQYKKYDYSI